MKWYLRVWVAYGAFWAAFGLGCIVRGQGNETVHIVCASAQIVFTVINFLRLRRLTTRIAER